MATRKRKGKRGAEAGPSSTLLPAQAPPPPQETVEKMVGPPPLPDFGRGEAVPAAEKAVADPSFLTLPDSQVALILAQIQKVNDSLAGIQRNEAALAEELRRVQIKIEERERAEATWETNRQKMVDSWREKSAHVTPEERAQAQARAAQELATLTQVARASAVLDLAAEPRVRVKRPGRLVTVRANGSQQQQIVPEVYRLAGQTYVLPPDVEVEVPLSVARLIEDSVRSERENAERKAALGELLEDTTLAERWQAINRKYNSPTHDPLGGEG